MTAPPSPDRPWISCYLAISADGKIATVAKRPCGWTSARDHQRLRDLRRSANALLAECATVEMDLLTLTTPFDSDHQPLRCVVSRSGTLPADHPLFHGPGGEIHWLSTAATKNPILPAHVICHHGSLEDFLQSLRHNHDVRHLHCEGSGEFIRSLAELDVIDAFFLTIAGHTLFGGSAAPTVTGTRDPFLPTSLKFSLRGFEADAASGECYLDFLRDRQLPHRVDEPFDHSPDLK